MKTRVVNLRHEAYDVYIGRAGHDCPGTFGNPIRIGHTCFICGNIHRDGGSTLACFRKYFYARLKEDVCFYKKVMALKGKTLGCFCKPKPCHGDVIIEFLEGDD